MKAHPSTHPSIARERLSGDGPTPDSARTWLQPGVSSWILERLAESDPVGNNLIHALENGQHPEETREWLHGVVVEALCSALDEIEREYRKLGTKPFAKDVVAVLTLKDGE